MVYCGHGLYGWCRILLRGFCFILMLLWQGGYSQHVVIAEPQEGGQPVQVLLYIG